MADTARRAGAALLHGDALEAALRHLRGDDDVALVGDVGAGRTTVLTVLAERLRGAGSTGAVASAYVAARR